jgi:hypothetical protein
MQPLVWMFFTKPSVSADNILYGLLKADPGFTQRDSTAERVGPLNVNYPEADKQAFWEHCLEITRLGSES